MNLFNSNSITFKRNSQLIKLAQSNASAGASANAQSYNRGTPQSKNNTQTNPQTPRTNTAPTNTPSASSGSGNAQSNQAQSSNKGQVDFYHENLLKSDNAMRTSLGLPPFKSVREMLEARSRLKSEYEAAMRYYASKNMMTEAQFKQTYPTVYDFEADQKRGSHNILERSFGDEAILNAIITNDDSVLNNTSSHEVTRVMNEFVKRLPSIQKGEDLASYEHRVRLALAPYDFTHSEVKEYFVKIKLLDAKRRVASQSRAFSNKAKDEQVIQDSRSLQSRTPIRVTRFDQ